MQKQITDCQYKLINKQNQSDPMYKIEKNVPIIHGNKKKKECPYPFGQTELNDSFLIPESEVKDNFNKHRIRIVNSLRTFNKDNNTSIQVKTRYTTDGLRVWRIA